MTQALLSAVGAPGSLGFALTTSMRSSASPGSSSVDSLPAPAGAGLPSPDFWVGPATPVTIAMPPGPDWHITSSFFVPFSSFSIESWRRLVMMVVLTDDLICENRARYGLAAADFPHA